MSILALGVPIRWADAGPADFLPFIAMLAAVVIARFLLGVRMTVMTFVLSLAVGAAWASAVGRWGWTMPTLAAVMLMFSVSVWVEGRQTD